MHAPIASRGTSAECDSLASQTLVFASIALLHRERIAAHRAHGVACNLRARISQAVRARSFRRPPPFRGKGAGGADLSGCCQSSDFVASTFILQTMKLYSFINERLMQFAHASIGASLPIDQISCLQLADGVPKYGQSKAITQVRQSNDFTRYFCQKSFKEERFLCTAPKT
jgi:hypothetical protein